MRSMVTIAMIAVCGAALGNVLPSLQGDEEISGLKREVISEVERMKDFSQQMVDMIFSFGELGFQEFETSRYCINILKKNGFEVSEGISGMPTAWMASWGSGKPVIALGSDIDGIPQASQKPGVAYRDPLIEGAPGHGEGHNSGQAVNITAALAVKKLMEREGLRGTIKLWPGVAEEQLGSKAYLVRDGHFKNVDVVLFSHVSDNLGTSYGPASGSVLISVEYTFKGESAHAAGSPWRGRSALDAVELMDVGWNFKREHLRIQQRSHYVITNGGDQPNVVPSNASVWYFFRETDYARIKELHELGNAMAKGAAVMTGTQVSSRILGSAWPRHFNKVIAETLYENMKEVGLPQWSEADQTLARAVQKEAGSKEVGLMKIPARLGMPVSEESRRGGGSDDIGDVSWNVPTVTLHYPANIPGLPGHNWLDTIAMATPIAHKGVTAGAKAMAATMIDLFTNPELIEKAWDYFRNVQTKQEEYEPLISATDRPAVDLNREIMQRYRNQMREYYFDPTKYRTYLEQLGIAYPTLRK